MKLQSIINNLVKEALEEASRASLNEIWLDEAEYPESFSFEELKGYRGMAGKTRYLQRHFGKKLGKGSARIVFPVDGDTVLKVALNEKGVAQNDVEIDAGKIGYEHIAKVYDFDDDSTWLEMERAERLKKTSLWPKLTGIQISFFDWYDVLTFQIRKRLRGGRTHPSIEPNVSKEILEQVYESEMFNDIMGMIANHDMSAGDMGRPSSWGVVSRGGKQIPVLIDYGITPDVLRKHYS